MKEAKEQQEPGTSGRQPLLYRQQVDLGVVGESLGEPGRRLLLPGVLCLPGAERRDGQAQLVGQPGEPQETLGETTIQPKLAARLAGWGREMANFQQQAK